MSSRVEDRAVSGALTEPGEHLSWCSDAATLQITALSPAVERLFGYPLSRWLTEPDFLVSHLHPEDRERALALHRAVATDGRERQGLYRLLSADGEALWIRTHLRRLFQGAGSTWQLLAESTLLTAPLPALEADHGWAPAIQQLLPLAGAGLGRQDEDQQASLERLRSLVESSPDPIFLKDGQGRWLEVNSAALKMLHFDGLDYYGKTDRDLAEQNAFYREALLACIESDENTWRSRQAGHGEEAILHPDGTTQYYDVIKVPLFHPDGSRKGLVVLGRNITERKRAEQERDRLLHQEQEARAAAEASRRRSEFLSLASKVLAGSLDYQDTLATIARLGVPLLGEWSLLDLTENSRLQRAAVVHANPSLSEQACALLRCVPSREVSGGLSEVIGSGRTILFTGTAQAGAPGGGLLCCHPQAHQELLERLGFRSCLSVPLMARGRALGALTFVSGHQERHWSAEEVELAEDFARRAALAVDNARLYRESQEAIQARDEFLSIASHELRTPLTVLHMGLERLLRLARSGTFATLPTDTVISLLENTQRQDKRLTRLIHTLLDVSELQADRLRLELERVDLTEVARGVTLQFEDELARAQCHLTLRAEAPQVGRWDSTRLEQIASNLLANAVKYGAGHPIEVRVEGDAHGASLKVRDQGIGIPPERLPYIFGRFERAVSSRHYGGLGLGLYIVRQLVERMGGSITVESELGKGSTFTVRLPWNGPPETASRAPGEGSLGG